MSSKRLYYILVATIGLLVVGLIGGAYGADSLLKAQSQKLLDARTKVQGLENQQTGLVKARKDIEKYSELGTIAKSIVPQDKDQAQTVREIVKIASAAGVKLGSITFPSSSLGAPVAAPAAPAPAAEGAATPAPAAAPTPNLSLSQLKPVVGITGVYDLAITVQSDTGSSTTYSQFIKFLEGLESNRRTALVSGIIVTPDAKNSDQVSFTLNINEYIKP